MEDFGSYCSLAFYKYSRRGYRNSDTPNLLFMGKNVLKDLSLNCTCSLKVWVKSASPEPEAPRRSKEVYLMFNNTAISH